MSNFRSLNCRRPEHSGQHSQITNGRPVGRVERINRTKRSSTSSFVYIYFIRIEKNVYGIRLLIAGQQLITIENREIASSIDFNVY